MTPTRSILGIVVALQLAAGCYRTTIRTGRPGDGAVHSDRQWFTLAGLVRLSDPDGGECAGGLARADSRYSFTDVLINFGLFTAGYLGGSLACRGDEGDEAACAAASSTLVPLLIGSRTVDYECADQRGATGAAGGLVPWPRNQASAAADPASSPR
jgi:hypothetical protein